MKKYYKEILIVGFAFFLTYPLMFTKNIINVQSDVVSEKHATSYNALVDLFNDSTEAIYNYNNLKKIEVAEEMKELVSSNKLMQFEISYIENDVMARAKKLILNYAYNVNGYLEAITNDNYEDARIHYDTLETYKQDIVVELNKVEKQIKSNK